MSCLFKSQNEASNHMIDYTLPVQVIPVGIFSGDGHDPFGLSLVCPVYLHQCVPKRLAILIPSLWEKSGGKDVNIMPG